MSIASMIQANTQEQGKQFSALTQSLADLGKQVTLQLERKEYVKQAQEQLPYMQQAMRDAMNRISSGDVAGGYSEAMMSLPLASQNPIIATAAKTYFAGMQQAAEFQQKAAWQTLQQDMLARKYGGTTEGGMPGIEAARQRMGLSSGRGAVGTRGIGGGQPLSVFADEVDQQATDSLPVKEIPAYAANRDMSVRFEDAPQELPTGAGTTMAPGAEKTMSFGLREQPEYSPTQAAAAQNAQTLLSAPPEQREEINNANIAFTQGVDTTDYTKVTVNGLKRFIGSDDIYVPPIGKTFTISTSAKSDKPGYEERINEVLVGKEDYEKNVSSAKKLSSFISIVDGQRPAGGDKTLNKLFNEAGGLSNITIQPNDGSIRKYKNIDKLPMLMYYGGGKEPVALNQDQTEAVAALQALSTQAPSAGWVFGKGVKPRQIAERSFNSMTEAEASGLPDGTTVYIGGKKKTLGETQAQPATRGLTPSQSQIKTQEQSAYKSADDVVSAIKSGKLTREQGKGILQNQFGYK